MDPKKVMVGGMPYYVTEDDIHEFFQDCGTISELDCMIFPDTGRFRGIAFITFRVSFLSRIVILLESIIYACDQVTESNLSARFQYLFHGCLKWLNL